MDPQVEILSWAHQTLIDLGYQIKFTAQLIKDVPWSTIYCFDTSKGRVFLKTMAKPFAIEPTLLAFLSKNVSPHVPHVITTNLNLRCFLMKDSGLCLRDILKSKFNEQYFCPIFQIYADIQIGCIPFVEELITSGLNDWRLKNLPGLYQNLLKKEDLLSADGLSQKEIAMLKKFASVFENTCEALAACGIAETLEHGDFHDNNVLINNETIFINDWGDACISHPFFSFLSFFNSAKRHHQISENDSIYKNSEKVFLNKWSAYAAQSILMKAMDAAKNIKPVVFALSFSRIFCCPQAYLYPEYKGYIADALRDFIKRNK